MHHYLKERQIEAVPRSGNHFISWMRFLQYFEGCRRVSSFYLNNMDTEVSNELQSRCHPHNCKLDEEYPENCAETCAYEGD